MTEAPATPTRPRVTQSHTGSPYRAEDWRYTQLQHELKARNLSASGTREKLIRKLEEHDRDTKGIPINYGSWRYTELKEECPRRGIPFKSSWRKADLREIFTLIDQGVEVDFSQYPRETNGEEEPPTPFQQSPTEEMPTQDTLFPAAAQDASPGASESIDQDVSALELLRAQHKKDRDSMSFTTQPFRTAKYFVLYLIASFRLWFAFFAERLALVIALAGVVVGLWFAATSEGSHQAALQEASIFFYWYGGWTLLGFMSSAGLGFGLHTFLLYLMPFIARVVMKADKCGHPIEITKGHIMLNQYDVHCDAAGETVDYTLSVLIGLVFWEAFCWGAGTAIGELLPFFFARAASISGEKVEGIDHFHVYLDQSKPLPENFTERLTAMSVRLLHKWGFVGILLFASVPNPLFDMAGLLSGYLQMSFWTFFIATLIGKAVIKVSVQSFFVIGVTSQKGYIVHLLDAVETYLPSTVAQFLRTQYDELSRVTHSVDPAAAAQKEQGFLGYFYHIIILAAIAAFVVAYAQNVARLQLRAEQEKIEWKYQDRKQK